MFVESEIKDFRELKIYRGSAVFSRLIFSSWIGFYCHRWHEGGKVLSAGYDTLCLHSQLSLEGCWGI